MNRKIIIWCIILFGGGLTMGTIIFSVIDYFESFDLTTEDLPYEIKYCLETGRGFLWKYFRSGDEIICIPEGYNIVDLNNIDSETIALSERHYKLGILVEPERITCRIDAYGNGASSPEEAGRLIYERNDQYVRSVPVNIEYDGFNPNLKTVEFEGVTAIVRYSPDESMSSPGSNPTQPFLIMMITDESGSLVSSTMYDYYPTLQIGPINLLHFDTTDKQIRLQCWIPQ